MDAENHIIDLRSAIEFLKQIPGQLLVCNEPVNPNAELAGVYRRVGAGTPVEPPTKEGPAMLFEKVSGYDISVITGVLAGRKRVAQLLGTEPQRLPHRLLEALENPVAAEMTSDQHPPCQEVIHDSHIDTMKLLPAPTNTPLDAGPYFTMGLIRAEDPETGEADVTIHRLCVQGKDLLSVYFVPGRHIDQFRIKAEKAGKPLPVSINSGKRRQL